MKSREDVFPPEVLEYSSGIGRPAKWRGDVLLVVSFLLYAGAEVAASAWIPPVLFFKVVPLFDVAAPLLFIATVAAIYLTSRRPKPFHRATAAVIICAVVFVAAASLWFVVSVASSI